MARKKSKRGAIRAVFRFVVRHWAKQPVRITVIMAAFMLATLSDVATPYFAGALVDAISKGAPGETVTWNAAIFAPARDEKICRFFSPRTVGLRRRRSRKQTMIAGVTTRSPRFKRARRT